MTAVQGRWKAKKWKTPSRAGNPFYDREECRAPATIGEFYSPEDFILTSRVPPRWETIDRCSNQPEKQLHCDEPCMLREQTADGHAMDCFHEMRCNVLPHWLA